MARQQQPQQQQFLLSSSSSASYSSTTTTTTTTTIRRLRQSMLMAVYSIDSILDHKSSSIYSDLSRLAIDMMSNDDESTTKMSTSGGICSVCNDEASGRHYGKCDY
jgi:hypothetical protein